MLPLHTLYAAIKFTLKQRPGLWPRRVWELSIICIFKKEKGLGTLELGAHLWEEMGRTCWVFPAQCGTDRSLRLRSRGSSRRPRGERASSLRGRRTRLRELLGRKHPRDFLSSGPNAISSRAWAPVVCLRLRLGALRHGPRGSQRYLPAIVAAARVRCRPWPGAGGPVRGRWGAVSNAARRFNARHWHRFPCGRRRRLGLQPREGGGGACPQVTLRRRKGGPLAAALGTARGRKRSRVRKARESENGSP